MRNTSMAGVPWAWVTNNGSGYWLNETKTLVPLCFSVQIIRCIVLRWIQVLRTVCMRRPSGDSLRLARTFNNSRSVPAPPRRTRFSRYLILSFLSSNMLPVFWMIAAVLSTLVAQCGHAGFTLQEQMRIHLIDGLQRLLLGESVSEFRRAIVEETVRDLKPTIMAQIREEILLHFRMFAMERHIRNLNQLRQNRLAAASVALGSIQTKASQYVSKSIVTVIAVTTPYGSRPRSSQASSLLLSQPFVTGYVPIYTSVLLLTVITSASVAFAMSYYRRTRRARTGPVVRRETTRWTQETDEQMEPGPPVSNEALANIDGTSNTEIRGALPPIAPVDGPATSLAFSLALPSSPVLFGDLGLVSGDGEAFRTGTEHGHGLTDGDGLAESGGSVDSDAAEEDDTLVADDGMVEDVGADKDDSLAEADRDDSREPMRGSPVTSQDVSSAVPVDAHVPVAPQLCHACTAVAEGSGSNMDPIVTIEDVIEDISAASNDPTGPVPETNSPNEASPPQTTVSEALLPIATPPVHQDETVPVPDLLEGPEPSSTLAVPEADTPVGEVDIAQPAALDPNAMEAETRQAAQRDSERDEAPEAEAATPAYPIPVVPPQRGVCIVRSSRDSGSWREKGGSWRRESGSWRKTDRAPPGRRDPPVVGERRLAGRGDVPVVVPVPTPVKMDVALDARIGDGGAEEVRDTGVADVLRPVDSLPEHEPLTFASEDTSLQSDTNDVVHGTEERQAQPAEATQNDTAEPHSTPSPYAKNAPDIPEWVIATRNFMDHQNPELCLYFRVGEIIQVSSGKAGGRWWTGRLDFSGEARSFPPGFVKPLLPPTQDSDREGVGLGTRRPSLSPRQTESRRVVPVPVIVVSPPSVVCDEQGTAARVGRRNERFALRERVNVGGW
ncbi:hypothetical protein FPV67DRAFT_269921 [Lyophyllum atratum]|nr:hypothetical protein FPV67DRAFT_269921 [Lyophyllum atratum]